MSIQIQLGAYPGRAGNTVPIVLSYSSKVWGVNYVDTRVNEITGARLYDLLDSAYGQHSVAGWVSNLSIPRIRWASEKFSVYGEPGKCPNAASPQCYFISRLQVYLPDGSSHELRKDDLARASFVMTGIFYAVDDSRLKFETATNTLWMPDGSSYVFTAPVFGEQVASKYVDRNGNTININQSTRQWTDTRGRVISDPLPVAPALGGSSQYEYDPNRPQEGDPTYEVAGVNGTTKTVTFRWRRLAQVLTPDPVTGVPALRYRGDFKNAFGNPSMPAPHLFISNSNMRIAVEQELFNPVVLNEISLPNGSSYKFTYNEYGEIDKIVYPAGGYERFLYGKIPGLRVTLFGVYSQTNRGVLSHWVSPTGLPADEQPWLYSASLQSSYYLVTQTAPNNTRTERYMHRSPYPIYFDFDDVRAGMVYEERSYSAANELLRRSLTKWAVSGPTSGGHPSATRNPRAIKTVSVVLDTGLTPALAATKVIRYEQASQPLNATSSTEYNYDSVDQATAATVDIESFNPADSLALRTTETAYLDNPDYNARNLTSLPTSVTIRSGMPASGQVKALSQMFYDESSLALLPCGASVGWVDPGTPARANATTMKIWLDSIGAVTDPNAYLATHTQYDQCGNQRKLYDAKDTTLTNPAQVEYSSAYQCAFPTLSISHDPDGGGPLLPLTVSTEYDASTGLVTATVDANGQRTTFGYSDPLNRITQIVTAAGDPAARSQSTYAYDDSARTVTVTSDLNSYGDNLLKVVKLYDGMGRTSETQAFEGPTNYIATRQEYDEMGRAFRTSNPFRPQTETVAWTTSAFDALGRVKTVTTPDSAVITTNYVGNTVTAIDQAGKKRRTVTDGLGRLIRVDEPDANGNLDVSGAPAQSTVYSLDALDSLTLVSQGAQTRTFVYDSLKRLTSTTTPESGLICYGTATTAGQCQANGYDANGNLIHKTDARGIFSTYTYDALNRNTSIVYTNDPASTPAVYRYYDGWKDGASQNIPNSNGRLWQTETTGEKPSRTTINSFDALGRALSQSQQFDSFSPFTTQRTFNLAGVVTSQTYPSGHVVGYTPDAAGRTEGFNGNLGDAIQRNYSTEILYSPLGGISKEKLGTNTPIFNKLRYNSRGQLAEMRASTSYTGPTDTTSNRGKFINWYSLQCGGAACNNSDNNGNLRKQETSVPNSDQNNSPTVWYQQYDYDSLNRLERVHEYTGNTSLDWQQSYSYDRWGNRKINIASGATFGSGINAMQTTIDTATNRLYAPNDPTHALIQYDVAGNQTKDSYSGNGERQYDAENRMIAAQDNLGGWTYYAYDGDGKRVRSWEIGAGTSAPQRWQVNGFEGELVAEYVSSPWARGLLLNLAGEYGYRNGQLLVKATVGTTLTPDGGGGFESPNVGNGNYVLNPSGSGWSFSGTTGISGKNSALTIGNPSAPEGNQVAFIQGGSSSIISQTISGLTPGATYAVTFSAAQRGNCCGGGGEDFRVFIVNDLGSVPMGTFKPTTTDYQDYSTIVFSPQTGLASLQFVGLNSSGGDNTALIDNVRIVIIDNVEWTVADQLGTPRMVFDKMGTLEKVKRHDYLPFGEELMVNQGLRTNGRGYGWPDGVRQKFTQYERDSETGLDFAQARYYASLEGRFVSPDPYSIVAEVEVERNRERAQRMLNAYLSQPQNWNRYTYTVNNPLNFTDPTGEVITLTGTAEEQLAAWERIKKMLGAERMQYVQCQQINGNLVLSIESSDLYRFAGIGGNKEEREFSSGMAQILASKEVLEFREAETFKAKDGQSYPLKKYGGGVTLSPTESTTGNVQIFVHPESGKMAAATPGASDYYYGSGDLVFTNDMGDAHEFGHGHILMFPSVGPLRDPFRPETRVDHSYTVFENAVRSRYPSKKRRADQH